MFVLLLLRKQLTWDKYLSSGSTSTVITDNVFRYYFISRLGLDTLQQITLQISKHIVPFGIRN